MDLARYSLVISFFENIWAYSVHGFTLCFNIRAHHVPVLGDFGSCTKSTKKDVQGLIDDVTSKQDDPKQIVQDIKKGQRKNHKLPKLIDDKLRIDCVKEPLFLQGSSHQHYLTVGMKASNGTPVQETRKVKLFEFGVA